MAKRKMNLKAGVEAEGRREIPKHVPKLPSQGIRRLSVCLTPDEVDMVEDFVLQCIAESRLRHSQSSVFRAAIHAFEDMSPTQRKTYLKKHPPLARGGAADAYGG